MVKSSLKQMLHLLIKANFNEKVKARYEGDFPVVTPEDVTLMDVAPNQIASIAASLIPFWSMMMQTVL